MFFLSVIPVGLEPTVYRLKVGGFIQLSYEIFLFTTLVALVTFHNFYFLWVNNKSNRLDLNQRADRPKRPEINQTPLLLVIF